MNIFNLKIYLFLLTTTLLSMSTPLKAEMNEDEAQSIAVDAYIYGYPLVTMEMTRRVLTNIDVPTHTKAPMGQFANAIEYPNAAFTAVTAPNADTLYSTVWLDLSKEPYVFRIPNENNRYYLMPMLSGWTNVFSDPGKRTTGTEAQEYVITGPDWVGDLPSGIKEIKSPTNLVWILGRTYCTGTPEDYKEVHALQDQYSLTPLSAYGKTYTPPKGEIDPSIDMKTPVGDQVNRMGISTYFNLLATLMKGNPPAPEDAPLIEKMAKIGVIPGKEFSMDQLDAKIADLLPSIPKIALKKIMDQEKNAGKIENGWVVSTRTGRYGTDYLHRALVAIIGLGTNLPQDAIYPYTDIDNQGKPLNGANRYIMHFSKEQIPAVNGFWSLTMYNSQYFFVNNPLNRYTLSPRNSLVYNTDGSLDFYIQNESPGQEKESNWLPSPKEGFILMMRLYWPKKELFETGWAPPKVTLVEASEQPL